MEITEVRIKLVTNPSERLRAFCSITMNGDFVIRDLKIIEGVNGVFVAMPSRKLADRCPRCGCKNHLRAKYCNECGAHLKDNRAPKDGQGRAKLHADIAHPINAPCRERIQKAVVEAYQSEVDRSKLPDYKPQSFDDFEDYDSELAEMADAATPAAPTATPDAGAARRGSGGEQFTDYDSLIADLKREAADRQKTTSPPQSAPTTSPIRPLRLPPAEGENAMGKPAYTRRSAERPADAGDPARASSSPAQPAAAPESEIQDSFGAGLA